MRCLSPHKLPFIQLALPYCESLSIFEVIAGMQMEPACSMCWACGRNWWLRGVRLSSSVSWPLHRSAHSCVPSRCVASFQRSTADLASPCAPAQCCLSITMEGNVVPLGHTQMFRCTRCRRGWRPAHRGTRVITAQALPAAPARSPGSIVPQSAL